MIAPDRERLWRSGIVAVSYLRRDQLPLYEMLLREKNPFLECARRYGKTTTILCFVFEHLIQHPGSLCRWCEPDKNQAREIVIEEVDRIQREIPRQFRFQYKTVDSHFVHPNGSKIYLRGVNHDRGDSARGPTAHIVVGDEFGTWKDPDYIVTSALRPQLQTTNGPFIFASTPPEDPGHAYYEHKNKAMREGRFIQRLIYDNTSLSPERIAEIISECGGVDTPAFQREYLCKPVTDAKRLVIPEFNESIHVIPNDYPRPACFDAYEGWDFGFNDNTGAVFAYWDFLKTELVIEDDLLLSGVNSGVIVKQAKEKELALWGLPDPKDPGVILHQPPYMRWGDNELQQLHDMSVEHDFVVNPTAKDDRLAAINALRLRFTHVKIKIKERCQALRYQLKVGIWNAQKTDFQRGEKTGHLDLIAALIYLSRNINEHRNPYPQNAGATIYTHFIPESSSQGAQEQALARLFEPYSRGRSG